MSCGATIFHFPKFSTGLDVRDGLINYNVKYSQSPALIVGHSLKLDRWLWKKGFPLPAK